MAIERQYDGIVGLSPCPDGLAEYSMAHQLGALLPEKQINSMHWKINPSTSGSRSSEVRGYLSLNEPLATDP